MSRHSRWASAPATRGGLTTVAGSAATPASSHSDSPAGNIAEVRFIASSHGSLTCETTNSRRLRMLASVSFMRPSGCHEMLSTIIGGCEQTAWK